MEQQMIKKQAEAQELLNCPVFCLQKDLNMNLQNYYIPQNKIPITPVLDFRQQPLFYIVGNVDNFYDTFLASLTKNHHQKQILQQQKIEQQLPQENPPIRPTKKRKTYTKFFTKRKSYQRQKKIFTFGLKKLTQAMQFIMSKSVQSVYTYQGIIENILSSFEKQIVSFMQFRAKKLKKQFEKESTILQKFQLNVEYIRNQARVNRSMGNSKLEDQVQKKKKQNNQREKQLLQKYQIYCNYKINGVKISPQLEQIINYCQNNTPILKVQNA